MRALIGSWQRVSLGMAFLGLALAASPTGGLAAAGEGPAAPVADKPAAPEVKAEQVAGGLQATLILKERTFRMGGGDNAVERKIKQPTLQLKNVGDKPVVLDFPLPEGGGFGGRGGPGGNEPTGMEVGPVRIFVKPAEDAKREDKPITLVVLKPGQVVEQPIAGLVRFPADGKYVLRFEVDVPAKDEVLPGVKAWSGRIRSNELEYDYQGGRGNFGGGPGDVGGPGNFGGRGNRGNRGGAQPQAPAPIPGDQGEAF
ncbi:MAG TPA: hypothetical protein PK280_03415 [Planctomycetota bacterium]|nr:hypothetical protein [Planctomycetota bacterium]